MKKETKFFRELRKCLGKSDQTAERFIQELKDHVEDRNREESFNIRDLNQKDQKRFFWEAKMGDPQELAKLYKKTVFSQKFRRFLGIFVFIFVFISSEATMIYFDQTVIVALEILAMIGLFFYMFALPVVFFSIILAEISTRFFGGNILVFWPMRFVILPLLIAGFHTFIYLVFACDASFWAFRKNKNISKNPLIS